MLGAARALAGFDPARGVKFSSYAIAIIRGAIREEARQQDHLTRGQRAQLRRIQAETAEEWEQAAARSFEAHTGRPWRFETGRAPIWSLPHLSLDESVSVEGEFDPLPRHELLAAQDDTGAEACERLEAETLWAWVRLLPAQEREVIERYYRDDHTLREVARSIDRSESRAFQLQQSGVARLREWMTTTGAP